MSPKIRDLGPGDSPEPQEGRAGYLVVGGKGAVAVCSSLPLCPISEQGWCAHKHLMPPGPCDPPRSQPLGGLGAVLALHPMRMLPASAPLNLPTLNPGEQGGSGCCSPKRTFVLTCKEGLEQHVIQVPVQEDARVAQVGIRGPDCSGASLTQGAGRLGGLSVPRRSLRGPWPPRLQ